MDQITVTIENNNQENRNNFNANNLMDIAIVCDDDEIYRYYDNQINTSHMSNESGFDLVVTEDVLLTKETPTKLLPLGIKCAPQFNSGYYLYPRSSIFKTPVRMANSVGIIDMTYRGEIKAPVDFHPHLCNNADSYLIRKGTKLFQLCKPTLEPIIYKKVEEHELSRTIRGIGGFGSTGNNINII
jgi:dUTP pyrophosphatase